MALNLSDNDLGPDFISILGYESIRNLRELILSNTRMNNKSLTDLADYHTHHKFHILNLDISSNAFTIEGVMKLLNSMKSNQILRKLNLSRNDLSFGDEGCSLQSFNTFE